MKFPFKKYKGKISTTLIVLFSLFVANATFAQASNPDFLLGNWISPEKDLIINCYKCNNKYFGKVVWFKKYEGKIEDNANGIQESTWLNTVVVKDLTYCNGKWINGTIHDLKSDKTYDAVIKPRTNNSIDIRGYIYFQLFGRTITFYRYEEKQLPYFDTSN